MHSKEAKEAIAILDFSRITISADNSHHIINDKPLYNKKFDNVMSFHAPGVAAVEDESGAYHIDLKGKELYKKRFNKTFGYYDDLAAVKDSLGYYHINLDGNPQYGERYAWVGNFQEEACIVRDKKGLYFHIKADGSKCYDKKYKYAGDYKYGIAIVYDFDGFARHIDKNGKLVHNEKYQELGVFHKGFATAKDNHGMFHIDRTGKPIYNERYKWVEPFYNGHAFTCKLDGEKLIIDEHGDCVINIFDQNTYFVKKELRRNLEGMLVGYWNTQIIHSIVELGILGYIMNGVNQLELLERATGLPKKSLEMIVQVLKVWDFIEEKNGIYEIKYLGDLLSEDHPKTLKYASLMWGKEHYAVMGKLTEALKTYKPQFESVYGQPVFQYYDTKEKHGIIFNKAIEAYTTDYIELLKSLNLPDIRIVLDVAGGTGSLLKSFLHQFPQIKKGILFEMPTVIENAKQELKEDPFYEKIQFIQGNVFEDIPIKADTIIMSRVLHDWNEEKVVKILNNVYKALCQDGTLLIFEMVVPEGIKYDFGVTLNFSLLVTTGGKERTFLEYKKLLESCKFQIKSIRKTDSIISIIIATKIMN